MQEAAEKAAAFASPAAIKGLTGDEASSLLMLLKRFRALDEQGRPALELKALAGVEANFLVATRERLKTYLHRIGLCLQVCETRSEFLVLQRLDSSEILGVEEFNRLLETIKDQLATTFLFDYEPALTALVRECVESVLRLCPYLQPHAEALRNIVPKKMSFSGEPFMIPYEIDFMGGAQHLMWPDANLFTEDHILYLTREGSRKPDRRLIFYDYRYESLYCPLHELVHCIQTLMGQADASSWTAEHDASRLAQVLLQPLAEMESLREHLPQGKMEEIVLFVYDQMSVKHNSFSESQHQGYRRWRDSWGVLSPQSPDVDAFSSAEQEAEFTDYLKYKVGWEAFMTQKGKNLKEILDTCFKDRTGDLAGKPVQIPPEVSINEKEVMPPPNIEELKNSFL